MLELERLDFRADRAALLRMGLRTGALDVVPKLSEASLSCHFEFGLS